MMPTGSLPARSCHKAPDCKVRTGAWHWQGVRCCTPATPHSHSSVAGGRGEVLGKRLRSPCARGHMGKPGSNSPWGCHGTICAGKGGMAAFLPCKAGIWHLCVGKAGIWVFHPAKPVCWHPCLAKPSILAFGPTHTHTGTLALGGSNKAWPGSGVAGGTGTSWGMVTGAAVPGSCQARGKCLMLAAPADSQQPAWGQLVGEIAFQLDRRILARVFPDSARLYGFTVTNIPEKIIAVGSCSSAREPGTRYISLLGRLRALGYSPTVHPAFAESLVNTYGILLELPGPDARACHSPDFLRRVVTETVPPAEQADAMVLHE
uniref:Speriolin C-terminal domain-containing protein n=1 Tax=Falco tinnunculus TaxID=100819 RepID=A0A8C4UCC2_FALTI